MWASVVTLCLAHPDPSVTGRSLYLDTVRRSASRSPATAFVHTTLSPALPLQPDKRSPQAYGDDDDPPIYTTSSIKNPSRESVNLYRPSKALPFKPSIHIEPDPIQASDPKTTQSHFTIPRTPSKSNYRNIYRPVSYTSNPSITHSNSQKDAAFSNSLHKKRRPAHKRRLNRNKQRSPRVKKSRPAGRFIHHQTPGNIHDDFGPFHTAPGPLLRSKPPLLHHVITGPYQAFPGDLHHAPPKPPVHYTTPEPIHYTTPSPIPEPIPYTTPEPLPYTSPEPVHYSTPEPIHFTPPVPPPYTAPSGPHQAVPGLINVTPRPVHFAPDAVQPFPPGYLQYDYPDEVRYHIL